MRGPETALTEEAKKRCMASGKGRTLGVTDLGDK